MFSGENVEDLDLGPTPQQDQSSETYAGRDSYRHEDLAGIGAQFDE